MGHGLDRVVKTAGLRRHPRHAAKPTAQKEKFVPARFLVTSPNETTHFALKWPFGGQILKQGDATRPGTYVNPVGL